MTIGFSCNQINIIFLLVWFTLNVRGDDNEPDDTTISIPSSSTAPVLVESDGKSNVGQLQSTRNLDFKLLLSVLNTSKYSFASKANECKLAKSIGILKNLMLGNLTKKWYFDRNFMHCIEFYYTGHAGNSNNFDTCEQCFWRCLPLKTKRQKPAFLKLVTMRPTVQSDSRLVDSTTGSFTDVFQKLVRTLSLNEYPCIKVGDNNRVLKFSNGKKFIIRDDNDINEKESLLDLIKDKHSPWYAKYDWSNEANLIRESFISGKPINISNIEEQFKTLRFVDKNIKEIDKGLLKFVNLVELILTVNQIESCNSVFLPSGLQVLDLSGNQISDLGELVKRPLMELQHLGLAYNHITDLKNYLDPVYWTSLVSLDLSCNHFTDLKDLILNKIKNLTKLKNLVLYANPICLIPSYRGFIVDSLLSIDYLDDQPITKDERFRYYNMKLYPEHIKNEAEVQITVNNLKNLYIPIEMKYADSLPEFPVIVYKYVVKFIYVDDIEYTDTDGPSRMSSNGVKDGDKSYKDLLRDRFTQKKVYTNKIISTQQCDYNENIQFNEKGIIRMKHTTLTALRDFMLHGLEIQVVEQKLIYNPPEIKDNESLPGSVSKKGGQSPVRSKKDKKNLPSPTPKDGKKEKKLVPQPTDTRKKKDQNNILTDLELTNTEETIVASFHLPLDSILDCSNYKLESTFTKKLNIPEYVINEFEATDGQLTNKLKDKQTKDRKVPEVKKKPDEKQKKKEADKKGALPPEDDKVLTPKVLELNVKYDVLHFSNFDAFKSYITVAPDRSASRTSGKQSGKT